MFKSRLDSDGYVIAKGLVPPDTLSSISEFLQSRWKDAISCVYRDLMEKAQFEPSTLNVLLDERLNNLSGAEKQVLDAHTGHFTLEARLDEILLALPRSPKLYALLLELLNSKSLFMHMPPMARFILPGNRFGRVPPHQDTAYNGHIRRFLTVWVPFVPINKSCGGVRVFPKSHKMKSLARGQIDESSPLNPLWAEPLNVSNMKSIDCHMDVGDVLIMDCNLVHQSLVNKGKEIRFSMDLRFFSEPDGSTKHFLDLQSGQVVAPNQERS